MARAGGWLGRTGEKIAEFAQDVSGRTVVDSERLALIEHDATDAKRLRRTLDFIGYSLFNFSMLTGRISGDLRPQARRQIVQQSLVAWVSDPMAGQAVDLYVSFVLGRGVPRPQAHDADVQDLLDETWSDPANQEVATSFPRLVEKLVDYNVQSAVFFLLFDGGDDGRVRLGLLRYDTVEGVRRHPTQWWRILYYRAREQRTEFDYNRGIEVPLYGPDGQPQTVYYERYGAFRADDDATAAADANVAPPPDAMRRDGKVLVLEGNKTSEMAFGVPRMRRLLRWYTAYNEILEAHVDRMKAMASVYMKMTARGASQKELDRLAMMATHGGRSSALGASRDIDQYGVSGYFDAPQAPGVLGQNDALNYEPFKIDSGAGDVNASAPHLRAQFAGGSGFVNPGYFGAEGSSLAGAQAMELPTLKFVEREQELLVESIFRPFGERAIERALETGFLDEWRDPTPSEQEQIDAAEQEGAESPFELNADGRVRRDLGFTVSLPSPLKRAMLDLVNASVQTATAVDPNATNPNLSRWLFGFILREAFDVDDPQRIVDEVLPKHVAQQQADMNAATANPVGANAGQPDDGSVGPDGERHGAGNPYGAPVNSPEAEQRPPAARVTEAARARRRRKSAALEAFDEDVRAVAERELAALAGHNGNGNGNGH